LWGVFVLTLTWKDTYLVSLVFSIGYSFYPKKVVSPFLIKKRTLYKVSLSKRVVKKEELKKVPVSYLILSPRGDGDWEIFSPFELFTGKALFDILFFHN